VLNDCRCTPLLLPCGVCALLQVCKQQEALHEHSSKLADAKQQLQAQLADLLQHQEQLSQHKQELQQQVQQLQEQQQQHVGDKLQLQQQIEQLQASQQQLQETSALLAADVTAAKDHLQQNAAQSASAAAGKAGKQQQQQRDNAALSGASGDLQLQLSVPGNVTHTPIIIIITKS
jgi:peptidoglycan hydrolase CwlO-like protein